MFCHTREGGYPEAFENTGFPIKDFGNDREKSAVYKQTLTNCVGCTDDDYSFADVLKIGFMPFKAGGGQVWELLDFSIVSGNSFDVTRCGKVLDNDCIYL